ncbi:MAG: gamma carbonic anhydrase family protein [Spirochaetes bacterium]|nr:gamma carbonic anhydrase family protein [Spirochaetota bacterium]MBU0954647.1 gamma carbonic anhydrase family protein [Spirochaetota bacterium]
MIHAIGDKQPDIHPEVFVAWNAEVAGDVQLAEDSSVWFNVTIRADIGKVRIGKGSNIQDGTVVHIETGSPCLVGEHVTVGHSAILHSCIIEDDCLIGMGSIILDRARIGKGSIVGAGALVTQGKEFPPNSLIVGSPAKVVRQLTADEAAQLKHNNQRYIEMAQAARNWKEVPRG